MDKTSKSKDQGGLWRKVAIALIVVCLLLVIVVIVMAARHSEKGDNFPTCGDSNGNEDTGMIDLAEPDKPGPFHDLTKHEIHNIRKFLEKDSQIKAAKAEDAKMNQSMIFLMDLFPASKRNVLKYLHGEGKQPDRLARVIMFRGDLIPPKVEEYICGPLPRVSMCSINTQRNRIPFSVRPYNKPEFKAIADVLLPKIDEKIGYILKESYGTTFTNCKPKKCFRFDIAPVGTNLVKDVDRRFVWMWAMYKIDYALLHPVGFGILLNTDGAEPNNFTTSNVWYNGQLFDDLDQLIGGYNRSEIKKIIMKRPKSSKDAFSSLHRREDHPSTKPQRPPTLVEPDGRRYSLKERKVEYLGWSFHFRLSPLTGPSVFDVRFKEERIFYELGLSEIAVFYSANSSLHATTNFVDSGALIGVNSKSLIAGADCPETATFVNATFVTETSSEPVEFERALCLFENNNGYPLRRHMSYPKSEGGFYGGMLDSALVLRTALTIVNYDYIIDFIFHQNGAIETRAMATGYLIPSSFHGHEKQYGFQIQDNIVGNMHHHIFHFKADVDIHGPSNRYETLNINPKPVTTRMEPYVQYYQTEIVRKLKQTEKEALYKYTFGHPKYHLVHNNAKKSKYGEIKAYSISLQGMSKQLLPEDIGNEGTIPWSRYQLAVTKHKDDEIVSSSPYGMWDSQSPVTNFSKFIADDENLVDEDLVFWITQGTHHIPHTEDLPNTPTVGNHLSFFFLPFNYFDECPSMTSRDQIYIHYKDHDNPKKGLVVDRNGNSDSQCVLPKVAEAFDKLVEDDPDAVIHSRKP